MSFATKFHELYRKDQSVEKSAACTLTLIENFVHATANAATGNYAVTLPNVSESKGRVFVIWATIADAKTVTVQDQDESRDWVDIALNADKDMAAVLSTGEVWVKLEDRYT